MLSDTLVFLAGFGSGLIANSSLIYWLKVGVELSQLFAALAVFVAVASFLYEKSRDRTKSAIEQITFYREEILEDSEPVLRKLQVRHGYNPEEAEIKDIEQFDYLWVYENRHTEYLLQLAFGKKIDEFTQGGTPDPVLVLLNKLEELSMKIILTGTVNHDAMTAIQFGFVHFVEQHAFFIVSMRLVDQRNYERIEELYMKWRNLPRKSVKESVKEMNIEMEKHILAERDNPGSVKDYEEIVRGIREGGKREDKT